MGRERKRDWECFYLCIAGMIALCMAGCAATKDIKTSWSAREHLAAARTLFDKGDYEGSLKENQIVISLCDNTVPEDEALFYAGMIYAHYGYPKRDYQKSLDIFRRLVRHFPHSPFTGKAKIFIGILQDVERSKREIEALNRTIKQSKQVDIDIEEKKKGLSK